MFMMGIELASATYYSRNLSQRVKEGIETKLKKGEYGAPAPLGYKNKNGNIIPNKNNSHFIKEIFKLYTTGDYSISQITNKLYLEGFRTYRANKKVHRSVIHRILTNPLYCGIIVSKGKEYQGSFKPLISRSLFTKAQYLLNRSNHQKKQKHNFLFSNYLTCNKCNCKLTATIKKGKHVYYYCTNSRHNCDQHLKYLTEKSVDILMSQIMSKITIDPEIAELSLNLYIDDLKRGNSNKTIIDQTIDNQINNLNKKKNRLLDLLLNQQIDNQTYDSKKLEIETEITALENQKNHSKFNDLNTILELLKKFKNTAISLKKMYDSGDREVKDNLLKSTLWNATIENQKLQKVTYKQPFSYLENMGKNDDFSVWRARWDSNPRSSA
ncbi:recombinase family protein [Candidatus Shapirobacteria bacterium]|nr:recombinase family protein [Candidatus Shapirobacteria bacterium]